MVIDARVLFGVGGLLVGGALGSTITALILKKKVLKEAEQHLSEQILKTEAHYKARLERTEKELKQAKSEFRDVFGSLTIEDVSINGEDLEVTLKPQAEALAEDVGEVQGDDRPPQVWENRVIDWTRPNLISEENFDEDVGTFDKVMLVWFMGDDTLVNMDYELEDEQRPFIDLELVVANLDLDLPSSETICLRNPRNETDYRIEVVKDAFDAENRSD